MQMPTNQKHPKTTTKLGRTRQLRAVTGVPIIQDLHVKVSFLRSHGWLYGYATKSL